MTTPTFAEWCKAGGGDAALLWHPAGMPWACTSSVDLVSALSNTADADVIAFRKKLFGEAQIAGGGMTTRSSAIDVQIVPTLATDSFSISYAYTDKNGLDGGNYDVAISREPSGLTYSYRGTGVTPSGVYCGLDVIEDYKYDPTLLHATLANNFDGDATSLTFEGPTAAALHAAINTNTGLDVPTYLWFGQSCVMARTSTDNGDGTYTCVAYAGAFRTTYGLTLVKTEDGFSVTIANAPMSGIIGRPANMWLVLMRDGAIQDISTAEPILIGPGIVANNPRGDAGTWKITCRGWLDWWDVDIPVTQFTGELAGFRFCRCSTYTDNYQYAQMPHVLLYEWDIGTSAYVERAIWLWDVNDTEISAGEYLEFDSLSDVCESAIKAINDVADHTYEGEPGQLNVTDQTIDKVSYITGPVAWMAGWGWVDAAAMGRHANDLKAGVGRWQYRSEEFQHNDYRWISGKESDDTPAKPPTYTIWTAMPYTAAYFYQYDWTNDEALECGWNPDSDLDDYGFPNADHWGIDGDNIMPTPSPSVEDAPYRTQLVDEVGEGWPWTKDGGDDLGALAPDDYRLNVKVETDATTLSENEYMALGDGAKQDNAPMSGKAARIQIDTSGDNYIVADATGANQWGATSKPILRGIPGLMTTPGWNSSKNLLWGMDLFYMPGFQEVDPWALNQIADFSSTSLKDLLQGILGISSTVQIPLRNQITWIPDTGDASGNFKTLIDWDRLDDLATAVYDGAHFEVPVGTTINLWKAVVAVLQHLGIRPVLEYSDTQKAWWVTFEPLGIVSPLKAQARGRVYDDTHVLSTDPVEIHGNTWLAHTINLKTDYKNGTALLQASISNHTGLAEAAAGRDKFEIDDKLTQIKKSQYDEAVERMYDLLYHLQGAQPTVSLQLAPSALTRAGCGVDVLITSDVVSAPYTGTRGVDRYPATTQALKIAVSESQMRIEVTARLSPYASVAISPSLVVEDSWQTLASTTLTVSAASVVAANNLFASPNGGLTDLATFGCFYYDVSQSSILESDCTCTAGYRVTLFEKSATALYDSGASQNVWHGKVMGSSASTLSLADVVTTGQFRVELDSANNFQTAPYVDLVMIFADRDDADLQPCQLAYGWLADPETGTTTDSAAATARGMIWS